MQHHPFQNVFCGGAWVWFLALSIVIGILTEPLPAQAQSQAPGGTAPPAASAAAAPAAKWTPDSGHTAWMLVSTALVLLMTPGLGLFYGGMVRSKNVLATMMHSFFAMGLITIVWVTVGYTIAFGGDAAGGWFGDFKHLFLNGVDYDQPRDPSQGIPHVVFMAFQMMFAIITPALITGAFAERVKFRAYVIFMVLWSVLVYSPLAHWVWGGGLLSTATGSWLTKFVGVGALDFAGGTVVHISSGVSALVFILLIGKRRSYPEEPIRPNNLVITMTGAGLLWFGWYGFNGGSQLFSDGVASNAFVVTHICAASAAIAWSLVEWLHRGKASALGFASGLVAGLVCITPASGFVLPMPALIMGLIVSPICYFGVSVLKAKLGYDDSLDAFGIHGLGGTTGAICTGIFADGALANKAGGVAGLIPGRDFTQLKAQIVATAVTWAFAIVMTAVLVTLLKKTIGIRVSEDEEISGLDLTQHGEVGYNMS